MEHESIPNRMWSNLQVSLIRRNFIFKEKINIFVTFPRAPSDCAQYITGASGFIQSYNWQGADQITGNDFTFCIRKEKGYCSIAYFPAITSSTIDNFRLDDISTSILVSKMN